MSYFVGDSFNIMSDDVHEAKHKSCWEGLLFLEISSLGTIVGIDICNLSMIEDHDNMANRK